MISPSQFQEFPQSSIHPSQLYQGRPGDCLIFVKLQVPEFLSLSIPV